MIRIEEGTLIFFINDPDVLVSTSYKKNTLHACIDGRVDGWSGKAFYAGMGLNDDGRGVLYPLLCFAFSKYFRFKL
jgi:hypothetical protein